VTTQELKAYVLAVIETLAETGGGPAGHIYMALQHAGLAYEDFQNVQRVLFAGGWAHSSHHWWTLTDKGERIAAALVAEKAKAS
jgi:hypothetical protein